MNLFSVTLQVTILILSIISYAFDGHSQNETQKRQTHHHGEKHSDATHANKHMHQHDFETLLQRFEDPEREKWQKPDLVIEKLGDLSGKAIADIGAGTGYFAFRLAEKAKKVIALDIDQRFLDYIENKNTSLQKKLSIETRLVQEDNPKLSKGEADVVIVVNTYHHINNRPSYFKNLKENLRTGAQVMVVDFKKEDIPIGPPNEIKLAPEPVVGELIKAGFTEISIDIGSLDYHHCKIDQIQLSTA